MKNKKTLIIAAIVGIVAVGGAAAYFGGGELFQGYYRSSFAPTVTRRTAPRVIVPTFSVSCTPSKSSVTVGENMSWKVAVAGADSSDTLEYTWSGQTGDAIVSGPLLGNVLKQSEFSTFYNQEGTYTMSVDVKKTEAAPVGGWAPIAETKQANCSVEVKKPSITIPRLRSPIIDSNFTVSCAANRESVRTNENLVWKATVNGANPDDTLNYTWSGDIGQIYRYPGENALEKPEYSTFYSNPNTYTIRLEVERIEAAPEGGWAPLRETAETTCSIVVQPPPNPNDYVSEEVTEISDGAESGSGTGEYIDTSDDDSESATGEYIDTTDNDSKSVTGEYLEGF